MESRLQEVEKKVEALTRALEQLQARLDGRPAPSPEDAPEVAPLSGPVASVVSPALEAEAPLPLLGRTLLTFAGAFVIRGLTDRAVLPGGPGVALGLFFATGWIALAWRDAGRGQRLSAMFHATAAALIGYPLVVETASRLGVLSAPIASLALGGFTLALLITAWHRKLRLLAWLGVLGATGSAGVLVVSTTTPVPYLVVLWLVAAAALVLTDGRGWVGPRWPIALFIDVLVLRELLVKTPLPGATPANPVGWELTPMLAAVLLFLAGLVWRTWRRRLPVQLFDVAQTLVVVSLGLAALSRTELGLAAPGLLLAVGAFTTLLFRAPVGRSLDAWFYGGLGFSVSLLSGLGWKSSLPLVAVWGALGLITAIVGRWRLTHMLWGFSVVFVWAAAAAGGMLGCIRSGMLAVPSVEWHLRPFAAFATLLLALGCYLVMTVRVSERTDLVSRATALLMLGLPLLGTAALGGYAARHLLGGLTADVAPVIVGRTLGLIILAVVLALLRRLGGPRELSWGSAGMLVICGLKLLVQDLPNGNAAVLVVGLLALGLAVSLLPRVLKVKPLASVD